MNIEIKIEILFVSSFNPMIWQYKFNLNLVETFFISA